MNSSKARRKLPILGTMAKFTGYQNPEPQVYKLTICHNHKSIQIQNQHNLSGACVGECSCLYIGRCVVLLQLFILLCVRTEILRSYTLVHGYCEYFLNCLSSFDSLMLQELLLSQLPTPIMHNIDIHQHTLNIKIIPISPHLLVPASTRCAFKDNPELRMAGMLTNMKLK